MDTDYDFLPDELKPETGLRMNAKEKHKAAALLATGLTPNAVAKKMGRDAKTIRALAAKPETALMVQDFTERFAGKLEATAEKVLDAVTTSDIEKASLKDKAIASGIFFDKARLARGQSTSNVSVLFQVAEEAERLQHAGKIIEGELSE